MWDMQGLLLYLSIEHRNERTARERVREDEMFIPYAHLLHDPLVDPEEAKKLAA